MRRLLAAAMAALALAGCALSGPQRPYQSIGDEAATLRAAFNTDADKTRILLLVSPTCGTCLNGATIIQDDVMAQQAGQRLRGYVVWVPKLGAQSEHVPEATRTVTDTRATHYWDSSGYTLRAFRQPLGLDADAWDVYLLYRPGVRWEQPAPPAPDFWMHQLGGRDNPDVVGPLLDGPTFAAKVREAAS